MPGKNRRSLRIPIGTTKSKRSSKRITTIEDILTCDAINGILADLSKVKPDISDLIVIYMDKDKNRYFQITENTLNSTATWLLETTKLDVIMEDMEDTEEE